MKKIMSAMLGLSLMLGAATLTFAQDEKDKAKAPGKSTTKKKASTDKTDKAATKKASSKKKAATDKTDKKS